MPLPLLYNTGAIVTFPLIGTGTMGTFTTALVTPAGDIKIAQSTGGTFFTAVNTTNTGTIIAGMNFYQISLTTSELSCERFILTMVDQDASETYRDQALLFETFGNVSAYLQRDIDASAGSANLVQILATAVGATSGTLTNVGTVGALLTGTVSTVTSVVSANVIQILATGVDATSGTLTNVGTVGALLTGTVSTVTSVVSANLTQILGTAVDATSGTLTNVGTVGALLTGTVSTVTSIVSANLIQVLATAVNATSGTLTNIGTANTALGTVNADVKLVDGTVNAARNWSLAALGVGSGTAAGTLSTTQLGSDLFTSTADDFYKDAAIIFIGGTLDLQRTELTGYNGTNQQGTMAALTVAPAAGQKLILV